MAWLLNLSFVFVGSVSFAGEVKKYEIRIGGQKLKVEVAAEIESQKKGLMFRKSLGVNEGMLFIYPQEMRLSFWNKNTFIPLSIGFFDKNLKLVKIDKIKAIKSAAEKLTWYTADKAMYALEVNQGWFQKNKIKIGTLLVLPKDLFSK